MGEVVALVALLSGVVLSPELQVRYGRHSKNCEPVSVLRVGTSRLFREPFYSGFPLVRSTCIVLLYPLCWHLTAVSWHLICPTPIAGTITAEWLSSLGGSPRLLHLLRDLLYGRKSLRLPWVMVYHCLLDLDYITCRADTTGTPPLSHLAPKPLGSWNSLRYSANISFILPLHQPSAVRFFSLVEAGLLKGLCLALVLFLFMSFLTCLEGGIASSCLRLRCYEGEGYALGSRGSIFPMRGGSGSLDFL